MSEWPHPDQAEVVDAQGVLRFRKNAIVAFLLDAGPFDMNSLSELSFTDADRAQFAQLIGYSVSGWHDLSYVQRLLGERDGEEGE